MTRIPSLRSGLRLHTMVLMVLAIALAVTLFALGAAISRMTLQSVENEEGNKLAAEARYFAELLDLTIGQQLMDLRSRATVLPQLGLHRSPQRLSPWLNSIQQEFSDYTWIGFADPNGNVISATGELLKGKSVAAREWFIRGKNQPVTVDLHPALLLEVSLPSRSDGPWRFVDLSSPVHSEQGRLLGVLGAHLSWDWLIRHHQRFSDSLSRNRHADIVIVGDDGLARLTSPTSRMHTLGSLESFQRAKAGEGGWIRERWPEGQTFLVGYTRNPGYGEHHQLGWVTLIRLPEEHINDLATPALWAVWAAVGMAMMILIGAVILLLKLAIKPIETFASQAQRVAQQGGRMEITSRMSRELRLLAQATNEIIDALKRREASEQSKIRLLADVSHETRNPMQGVMGYARLLQSRASTPQDKHDIEQLIRCAHIAMDVANDTLLISADEAGQLKLALRPCRLRELIASSLAMVVPQAQEKGLVLTQSLTISDDVVMADARRLTQVMLNVLSNAIKFTDRGSIDVHAQTSLIASSAGMALAHDSGPEEPALHLDIHVTDTGIGMSEEEQQRVFDRWQQAANHSAMPQGGSGLGLAVSLVIVQAMGGKLTMKSVMHRGTTIHISLNFARAALSSSAMPIASDPWVTSPIPDPTRTIASPLHVLVVDDIAANREVLCRWLALHGHDVREAASGAIALAQTQDRKFDLILMDIDLPDINGRDAAKAIRASGSASRQAMICALSGHGFEEDLAASRQAGMDRHLIKPLDFQELQEVLDAAAIRAGRNTDASS